MEEPVIIDDPAVFEKFRESLKLALAYIQYSRNPDNVGEGEVKGGTSGQASNWGEIGQHWTYTDAVNVYGFRYSKGFLQIIGDFHRTSKLRENGALLKQS